MEKRTKTVLHVRNATNYESDWRKQFFSIECAPGYIILAGIAMLSCLWAGVQPVGFRITHLVALAALTVSLRLKPPSIPRFQKRNPIVVAACVFVAVLLLNLILTGAPALGCDMLVMTVDLLLILFVMNRMRRRTLKPLFIAMCIMGIVFAVLHLVLIMVFKGNAGVPGFLKHGGYHFGIFAILVAFPAIAGFLSSHRGSIRLWGLSAGILNFMYLLIDMKTIPVCIAIFGILLFIFRSRKHSEGASFIILIILLTVIGFAGYHLSDWLFQDLHQSITLENPLKYHLFPMAAAWRAGFSAPILGVGAGNFRNVSGIFKSASVQSSIHRAHNGLLELFAELGFVGLLSFLLLAAAVLLAAFRTSEHRRISSWIHRGFKISLSLMIPAVIWDFGPQLPANLLLIVFSAGFIMTDKPGYKHNEHQTPVYRYAFVLPIIAILLTIPSLASSVAFEMGRSDEKHGRLRSAAEHYEFAVRYSPFDDRFSAGLGLLRTRLAALSGDAGAYSGALEAVNRSLRRNSNQAQLYYAQAFLMGGLNPADNTEWTRALEKAVRLDPWNHRFVLAYAQSLIHAQLEEQAMAEIDRVIFSLSSESFNQFSNDFVRIWSKPDGISVYLSTRMHRLTPDLFLSILTHLMDQGYDAIARPLAMEYAERLPATRVSELYISFLDMLNTLKSSQTVLDLIKIWEPYAVESGLKARLLASGGDAFLNQNMRLEATGFYEAAVSIDPDNEIIQIKKLRIIDRQMKPEMLMVQLDALLKRFPESARIRLSVAREYQRLGMNLKALQEFRIANHLSGNKYRDEVSELETVLDLPELFRDDFYEKQASSPAGSIP